MKIFIAIVLFLHFWRVHNILVRNRNFQKVCIDAESAGHFIPATPIITNSSTVKKAMQHQNTNYSHKQRMSYQPVLNHLPTVMLPIPQSMVAETNVHVRVSILPLPKWQRNYCMESNCN